MGVMIVVFAFLVLLAEIVGTVGGFGSSLFFVPLAQFFFDVKTVLGITAVFHVFSNISKLWLFRKAINLKLTFLFGVPSVLMVILGAWLTDIVSIRFDQIALGLFLILFSSILIAKPGLKLNPTITTGVVGGGVAGFLAGFLGTGGAVRGLALTAFQLEKSVFVGTSAAIDMGVDLSRSVIYIQNGYLSTNNIMLLVVLFFVSILGSYIGKLILVRIEQGSFRKIVLWLIFTIGIAILGKGIYELIVAVR